MLSMLYVLLGILTCFMRLHILRRNVIGWHATWFVLTCCVWPHAIKWIWYFLLSWDNSLMMMTMLLKKSHFLVKDYGTSCPVGIIPWWWWLHCWRDLISWLRTMVLLAQLGLFPSPPPPFGSDAITTCAFNFGIWLTCFGIVQTWVYDCCTNVLLNEYMLVWYFQTWVYSLGF